MSRGVQDPALQTFLRNNGYAEARLGPAIGDASGRQYFRLLPAGAMLMVDPPPGSSLQRFLYVASQFRELGLSVPDVHAYDLQQGYAILEDLGEGDFTRILQENPGATPMLYGLAADILRRLADASAIDSFTGGDVPLYDSAVFHQQLALFPDHPWPDAHREISLQARDDFLAIAAELLAPLNTWPRVILHRDYHAGNLIHMPDRPGLAAAGVLDFQDSGIGPAGYDLVSLLEDARRDVPAPVQEAAQRRYWLAFPKLQRDIIGDISARLAALRHLRVIAVFNRLARDRGNPGYLVHIPRCKAYLRRHLEIAALRDLRQWIVAVLGETWLNGEPS